MRRRGSIALGIAAVIGAAPAQAQDAKPPRPQIDVRPRTVTYGDTALLTGSLVNGAADAGVPVALLRRAVPAEQVYHEVARMPAGPNGDIRFSLQPTGSAYYAVRTRTEPVQTSLGLLVRVTPAVELRVPRGRVRRGRQVRFAGTVRPDLAGTLVRIQRRAAGGYRTVARTRLVRTGDDTSSFGLRVTIRRGGDYRVAVPASGALSDGASSGRRIRVRG
jgi:hypothetical protein